MTRLRWLLVALILAVLAIGYQRRQPRWQVPGQPGPLRRVEFVLRHIGVR